MTIAARIFDLGRLSMTPIETAAQLEVAIQLMFERIEAWQQFYSSGPPLPDDTVQHLIDLAHDGDETIFKEYAQMVGVAKDQLDELWIGTRKRIIG